METLILYLGMVVVGYVIGLPLRNHKEKLWWIGKLQSIVVVTLITTMGLKMGGNEEVISNLSTIGIRAFLMAITALGLTILGATIARRLMGFDRYGNLKSEKTQSKDEETKDIGKIRLSNTTIGIIIGVIIGLILGYLILYKTIPHLYGDFNKVAGKIITYGLYILVASVGLDLSLDPDSLKAFRKAGLRSLVFPLVAAAITISTILAYGMIFSYTVKESLSIACTFCWYSLGPNIIMEAGMVTIGAVAFMSNFLRVLMSIFLTPVIAGKIGYIETTVMPMAASMDVCITVIEKSTCKQTAIYAFVSGAIFTALVPVVVPLIVSF